MAVRVKADHETQQGQAELLPEGWLSCPTSSVRFCQNRSRMTPRACEQVTREHRAHAYI